METLLFVHCLCIELKCGILVLMKGKGSNDNILFLHSKECLHKVEQNIVICKLLEIFFLQPLFVED